jgi:TfoX/Sxy family transcriptional regulator of competence genes
MYEKAGSTRFPHPISYWQVPDEVFEDTAKLWEWANISIAIAQAKAKPKKKRKL